MFPTSQVENKMKTLNSRHIESLNAFDRKALEEGEKHPIFIYNVSSVWEHPKFQGQLGTIRIERKKPGERVSKPVEIPGVVVRFYDHGLGRKDKFLETGLEIAQDICGCHPLYPAENPSSNLTNYGVFITEKPLEEYEPEEQEALLSEANRKHDIQVRSGVLEADQRWASNDPVSRKAIVEIHHLQLAYLGETRAWSHARGTTETSKCPYCRKAVEEGTVKCPHCSEIVDKKRYKEMKKDLEG